MVVSYEDTIQLFSTYILMFIIMEKVYARSMFIKRQGKIDMNQPPLVENMSFLAND